MSVHVETTADGRTVYRVRWREGGRGTANRNRTFDHERDAIDFDRRVRRLKQSGDPALLADEMTLRQYVHDEWWPNYAERRLALEAASGEFTAEFALAKLNQADAPTRALAAWVTQGDDHAPLQAVGGWISR